MVNNLFEIIIASCGFHLRAKFERTIQKRGRCQYDLCKRVSKPSRTRLADQ